MTKFAIRQAQESDIATLEHIADAMGAHNKSNYFSRCMAEQAAGSRAIFLSGSEGYAQLIWNPVYHPFRRLGIPEIQDVNVIPGARRQGLGRALIEHCEEVARAAGKAELGIGVGLHARFGAAQRLYVRLGYLPDGNGAVYDELPVIAGEMRAIDDLLSLKMIKTF
jgi:GNAT superfamily N-acetyltransferase